MFWLVCTTECRIAPGLYGGENIISKIIKVEKFKVVENPYVSAAMFKSSGLLQYMQQRDAGRKKLTFRQHSVCVSFLIYSFEHVPYN